MLETVIGIQGLSLDSTHTEPYAYKAQFIGQQTFAEFVTTALQHNLVRQGRFRGLLLCAANETQQSATAEVPTGRRVCKLLCRQGLLVVHGHLVHHLGA